MLVTAKLESGDRPGLVTIVAGGVRGHGYWRGPTDPPIDVDVDVDVELEVQEALGWDAVVVNGMAVDGANLADDELLLDGVAERVDIDGVLVLRVAQSIVQIDTVGVPPGDVVGRRVSTVARGVRIFPTGI